MKYKFKRKYCQDCQLNGIIDYRVCRGNHYYRFYSPFNIIEHCTMKEEQSNDTKN